MSNSIRIDDKTGKWGHLVGLVKLADEVDNPGHILKNQSLILRESSEEGCTTFEVVPDKKLDGKTFLGDVSDELLDGVGDVEDLLEVVKKSNAWNTFYKAIWFDKAKSLFSEKGMKLYEEWLEKTGTKIGE